MAEFLERPTRSQRKEKTTISKRQLEAMFDLPSDSACSFDSELGQAKETSLPVSSPQRGKANKEASPSTAASDFSVQMSSTMDTMDARERSPWVPADLTHAALNFNSALQSAPRQPESLWTSTLAQPEANFDVKAKRLVQEQGAFVQKVEQELKRFGQTLDQHTCFQEALKHQLEDQGRVWRKEAQHLAHDLQELRTQLAQTMEAALWSGKEVAAIRKEIASLGQRDERPGAKADAGTASRGAVATAAPLEAALAERLAQVEERLDTCNKHVTESNDFFAKAVGEVSEAVAQVTENLANLKLQVLRSGPGRPVQTVPKWLADSLDADSMRPSMKSENRVDEDLVSAEPGDQGTSRRSPRNGRPEVVMDGKKGARLGGRRIPVR